MALPSVNAIEQSIIPLKPFPVNDTLHTFESSLLHLLPSWEGLSDAPSAASQSPVSLFGEGWGEVLNNPFHYEPHPLCRLAAESVKRYIYNKVEWREEMERGKMFGVLIVAPNNLPLGEENARGLHFLTAYSGQILGRSDWEGFVPPVFDYLQPDGYFKTEERAIEQLNQRIAELSAAPERMRLKRAITHQLKEQEETLSRMRKMMEASKLLRHQRRQEARLSEQEKQELEHESQYQKAQYKRVRKNFSDEIARLQGDMTILNSAIEEMEKERKTRSRALQQWLFSHFMMLNDRGEQRSLLDLFSETTFPLPPAGAGECCEPKLLQYAFAHGLRPLAMAMFWYGGHSLTEVRLHGHFYPACAGKCRPILRWMLAHLCDFSNDREELSTLEVP